ncbi:MAG: signal peptidase I [Candidatus Paraimprobicoccus trichonymphae]|uniref:Signal peptidase I n=1 Tax=Candidatus Paraimprobicoccus trichonymphae TaxID=3033793 RepID=A0AA48KZI9_9FIRM|nr:MAG: signal peptidase I [Candidatus Paraimprobicoccus trichonymphae]
MCFDWLETICGSLIFVIFILIYVFRIVNVDGESMQNTLQNHDKLFIWEWYYTPKNGDVVVISEGKELKLPLAKRVIAIENQKLDINFSIGEVKVNGSKLNEVYIKEPMIRPRYTAKDRNGVYKVILMEDIHIIVPIGYNFVMGDNRNNSDDSRFPYISLIKNEHIIGRVKGRLWPVGSIGKIRSLV